MIFQAPAYKEMNINSDVQINLQLVVPSDSRSSSSTARSCLQKDKYVSEIVEFTYIPCSKFIHFFIRVTNVIYSKFAYSINRK